jgi:hypothetical protein
MCGRNADWSVTRLGARLGVVVRVAVALVDVRGLDAREARGAGAGLGGGAGIPWTQVASGRSQRSQYSSATRPTLRPDPA